jgi:hypothetical protein
VLATWFGLVESDSVLSGSRSFLLPVLHTDDSRWYRKRWDDLRLPLSMSRILGRKGRTHELLASFTTESKKSS